MGGPTGRGVEGASVAGATQWRLDSRAGLFFVLILAATVRFIDLGYQSYSMDELWEMTIVRLPAGEIATAGDGFPPLFHLIFRGMFVAGLGDFSARILSAALGVVAVWVVWRLGRRINPSVGFAGSLAVALTPLLVLLSKEARAYGLFILLAGLLLMATWDVIDNGTRQAWAFLVIVLALGMYTHYMFALAAASAEVVVLLAIRSDRKQLTNWLLAHGALAVVLVPLLLIAAPDFAHDASNAYSRTVDVAAIGYAGLSMFTGLTLGPSTRSLHTMGASEAITAALPWIILIGIPASYLAIKGWQALQPEWRIRLGVPLVLPLGLLTVFSAVIGVAFRVRYLSWLAIPLALWLAAGFFHAKGNLRYVAAATLIGLGIVAMVTRSTVDEYKVEDARAAAEFIAGQPETPAVAMAWYMTKPIEYYLDLDSATFLPEDEGWGRFDYHELLNQRIVPIPSLRPVDPEMTEQTEVFEAVIGVGEEYLFVHSRDFHADPDGEYFAIRREADDLRPVAEFAGITIYKGVRGK